MEGIDLNLNRIQNMKPFVAISNLNKKDVSKVTGADKQAKIQSSVLHRRQAFLQVNN